MKKIILILSALIFALILTNCTTKKTKTYKDGIYLGKSKAIYEEENFWGYVKLSIKNGKITDVNFSIIDSSSNEVFDPTYENHYTGNDLYIQQCRDDWQGILMYPKKLIKHQDIDEIDAISGATWSYNMFKYAINDALKNAKEVQQ